MRATLYGYDNELTGSYTPVKVDSNSNSLRTIRTFHAKVHDGDYYNASYVFPSVANSGTAAFLIGVGASKVLHLTGNIVAGGNSVVQWMESPTLSASGTALTVHNLNRTSTNSCTCNIYRGTTVSATGSEMFQGYIPGGTVGRNVGGTIREDTEWVLQKSKQYVLNVTNLSGGATFVALDVEWYEV